MRLQKRSLIFLSLLVFAVGVLAFSGGVSAATITVGPSGTYQTIQDAVSAAISGDTIQIAAGTYELTSEVDVNIPISIVGEGAVIVKANNAAWSHDNNYKHLFDFGGSSTDPINVSNIVFDSNNEAYGMQAYQSNVIFTDVIMKNSYGAGLTVNGATVVANNLTTINNSWGAVNVDPGSNVNTPSTFTLNIGTLNEDNKIWSDGSHVTGTATVNVNAAGYNEYLVASDNYHIWTNNLTNAATITKSGVTTLYSTINNALAAASSGDTIEVAGGNYNETLTVNKANLVIKAMAGATSIIKPLWNFTGYKWLVEINANNVTFEGFKLVGNTNMSLGIYTRGTNTTIANNNVQKVFTGIMTSTIPNEGSNSILNNNVSDVYIGIAPQNDGNYINGNNVSAYQDALSLASKTTTWGTNQWKGGEADIKIAFKSNYSWIYTGSIQDGINAASAGDTILVAPGLYTERIVIDKPLTLLGATADVNKNGYTVPADYAWNQSEESIIENPTPSPTGLVSVVLIKDTDNVTFKGFVVQSLNAPQHSQNDMLVTVDAETKTMNNITIENNVIGPNTNNVSQDGTAGRMGLYISVNENPYGLTNSDIKGNKIFDAKGNGNNIFIWGAYASYGAIKPNPMEGTIIEDNEIYGSHRSGLETAGGISGLIIKDNNIYGNSGNSGEESNLKYGHGILMVRGSSDSGESIGLGPENLTIENNKIHDNEKSGIYFGPVNKNYTIKDNEIYNNGFDGIRLDMEAHFKNPTFESQDRIGFFNQSRNIIANNNKIYDNGQKGIDVIGTPTNGFSLDASNNYWGSNPDFSSLISGKVGYAPWYSDAAMTSLTMGQTTTSDENGTDATLSQPVNLTSTEGINVEIPADVTVSSNDTTWDGIIQPPTVQPTSTVSVSVPGLSNLNVTKVIEVGIQGKRLNFTKAVKITIPDAAGNAVGYSYDNGATFTRILTQCVYENNQTWANTLPAGGDCFYSNLTTKDMTIWTKHFTQFVTYSFNDSQGPDISNITFSPSYPNPGSTTITVYAKITDPSGVKNYPQLRWRILENGTQTGPNPSDTPDYYLVPQMSPQGDGIYVTNLSIPSPKDNMSITYKITAEDSLGNPNYSSYTFEPLFTYDGSAPVTTDNASTVWTNQDVVVNITCSDSISGCNKTYYSTDGSSPTTLYTNPITLSATGQYQLRYYSTDNAGNVENVTNGTLVRIDKDNPTVTISVPTDGAMYNYSISSLNFTASDATSPLSACWYNNGTTNSTPVACGTNFSLTSNENSNTWTVYTNDSAGNLASASVTFNVDTTNPVVTISYPANQTYNTSVSQLNYSYAETNPSKCWYSTDKGVTNNSIGSCGNFTGIVSVEGQNNWTVYMNDTARNVGSATIIFTKDTVKPLISFGSGTTAAGNYSQNYIESNVSVSDPSPGTGINRTVTYLYNSTTVMNSSSLISNFTGLADGTYYLNATTWDNAGNFNSSATRKFVLDTIAPSISIESPSDNSNLTSDKTIYVNATDLLSGVKNVVFKLVNSSNTSQVYKQGNLSYDSATGYYKGVLSNVLSDVPVGTYFLQATATDNVGNENMSSITLSSIEYVLPIITPIKSSVPYGQNSTVEFNISINARNGNAVRMKMSDLSDGADSYTPLELNARLVYNGTEYPVRNSYTGDKIILPSNVAGSSGVVTFKMDIPSTVNPGNYNANYQFEITKV